MEALTVAGRPTALFLKRKTHARFYVCYFIVRIHSDIGSVRGPIKILARLRT